MGAQFLFARTRLLIDNGHFRRSHRTSGVGWDLPIVPQHLCNISFSSLFGSRKGCFRSISFIYGSHPGRSDLRSVSPLYVAVDY